MKTIKLSLLLLFTIALFSVKINAQTQKKAQDWCKTDQNTQELYDKNPALLQRMDELHKEVRNYVDNYSNITKRAVTYIIPVVVHNITHDGGVGYVTKADIEAQIATMNADFQRLNADAANTRPIFQPYAASFDVEFRLAHKDPNGNCTEGIVRLDHPSSANFSDGNKSVSYWNSKKYYNIWLVDFINGSNPPMMIAGYAQFPSSGINSTYGVVVDDSFFGGGSRTMTHEVGHCVGLAHTFQSGCGGNCSTSGDRICDTPPVANSTQGCNTSQNLCSNDASGPDPYGTDVVDQIENFMSYDVCQNMFTLEQKATADFYFTSASTSTGLAQLVSSSNLTATGTADPYTPAICAPIAGFNYNKEYICEGASVDFTDDSYNATPTAWNWTFTGGTPATSNLASPTIAYNTAGVYSVTYQPSTSAGSGTMTKTNIITVSSLTADYIGPIIDGFENTTAFATDWRIENSQGQAWQNSNAAAATGSRSMQLRNYFTNNDGEIDEAISPSYDISSIGNPSMKFKFAFAKKSAGNTDKLLVYYSTNCGEKWSLKLPLGTASLTTVPNQTGQFTPTASEWVEKTVSLTNITGASKNNVRFKFEFTSGGGNNIYIDDINIGGVVGLNELANIASFTVYPNPTSSSAQITFNLVKNVDVLSIKVRNAVGQEVTNVINGQSFAAGDYTLNIDNERKLSSGIYFIEFEADGFVKVQKLVIQ